MKKHILILMTICISFNANSQGNVGIGTINPTDQLHTTGTVRFEGYRAGSTRLMEIDSSGRVVITGGGQINSTTPSLTIPDNQCNLSNGVTSTISISGQPFAVQSSQISVRVNITHPSDGDLQIFLLAPNGAILKLAGNNGGAGANFTGSVFTDAASISIAAGAAPFSGLFKPLGLLSSACLLTPTISTFGAIGNGSIIPNGNWTLKVYDGAAGQVGTLDRWDLSFSGPLSFTTADNYGYVPYFNAGDLSPTNLYYASGYLGIGTKSPAYNLDVAGNFHTSGDIATQNINMSGNLSAPSATISNVTSSNTLFINGSLQVASGTPGTGKVLTSTDNFGNAVWQTPGTGISFDAYLTNSISLSSGTYVPTGFTKKYEDGGINFNSSTGEFTVPSPGVYSFHATVGWSQPATGNTILYFARFHVTSLITGTYFTQSALIMPTLTGNSIATEVNHIFKLGTGDKVFLEVYHSFNSNLSLIGGTGSGTTTFSAVKLY